MSKNYTSNNYKLQVAYFENDLYKRYGNRTVNNTSSVSKTINQYTTEVVNNYKTNEVSNLKKAYYNVIDGVVINKHNTIYNNGNITVTKINKLVKFNDSN